MLHSHSFGQFLGAHQQVVSWGMRPLTNCPLNYFRLSLTTLNPGYGPQPLFPKGRISSFYVVHTCARRFQGVRRNTCCLSHACRSPWLDPDIYFRFLKRFAFVPVPGLKAFLDIVSVATRRLIVVVVFKHTPILPVSEPVSRTFLLMLWVLCALFGSKILFAFATGVFERENEQGMRWGWQLALPWDTTLHELLGG